MNRIRGPSSPRPLCCCFVRLWAGSSLTGSSASKAFLDRGTSSLVAAHSWLALCCSSVRSERCEGPTQDPATTTTRPNSLQQASSSTVGTRSTLGTAYSTLEFHSCTIACGRSPCSCPLSRIWTELSIERKPISKRGSAGNSRPTARTSDDGSDLH